MGSPKMIWAISSIHGDAERLMSIHDAIFNKISAGDRVIYLGNYSGYGAQSCEVFDELLMFRRLLMAQPGMQARDVIYLRGKQEANWHRLMQLQFEQFPVDAYLELLGAGMRQTLESYGLCPHDGIMAARQGAYALSKWINTVRAALSCHAGHDCILTNSKRAAYTDYNQERFPVLFVNAGIDQAKPLEEQKSLFWDSKIDFRDMNRAYAPFEKVIRGYDSTHQGIYLNGVSASLDGGCGFGGSLVCASMPATGEIEQLMEA